MVLKALQSFLFTVLLAGVCSHSATASTIVLDANAGSIAAGVTYSSFSLSGPSFSFSGMQRGGAGYGYIYQVPVGSEFDFSLGFSGDYTGSEGTFLPQIRGNVGTSSALFQGSASVGVEHAILPAASLLQAPATLTGSFTGCVTPVGYLGVCDASYPDSYTVSVNLPGYISVPLFYDPTTNSVSYHVADVSFTATPATSAPEPSSYAVAGLLALGMFLRLRRA